LCARGLWAAEPREKNDESDRPMELGEHARGATQLTHRRAGRRPHFCRTR
jgi:hypothetical protein